MKLSICWCLLEAIWIINYMERWQINVPKGMLGSCLEFHRCMGGRMNFANFSVLQQPQTAPKCCSWGMGSFRNRFCRFGGIWGKGISKNQPFSCAHGNLGRIQVKALNLPHAAFPKLNSPPPAADFYLPVKNMQAFIEYPGTSMHCTTSPSIAVWFENAVLLNSYHASLSPFKIVGLEGCSSA